MKFLKLSLLIINSINIYVNAYDTSTLKLLQIVHRHGDRTPISFYPNDPYKSVDKWVDGLGELTPTGKERMYKFGEILRERYGNYLGNTPKNMYSRSSSSNRCLESAAALAAGMYKPVDRWVWSKEVSIATQWQPIAIQTVLKSTDGMLVTNSDCPAADAAYEETMKSKEVRDFMDSQKEFIEEVGKKTGEKYTTLRQLDFLHNTLQIEFSQFGLEAPDWVKQLGNNTMDRLKQFEWNAFRFDWSSKIVQRLRAGLILKELTQNMKNAINSEKKQDMKKLYSYSTHDTMIVAILQALGIYDGIPASYGSALLFELHEQQNKSFVHLFYANVTPTLIISTRNLTICGSNETICELNKFEDSVKQFFPNDWHKECNS